MADRSVSVPMTLSDLERRETTVKFQADLFNNARNVYDQIRLVNTCGEGAYF